MGKFSASRIDFLREQHSSSRARSRSGPESETSSRVQSTREHIDRARASIPRPRDPGVGPKHGSGRIGIEMSLSVVEAKLSIMENRGANPADLRFIQKQLKYLETHFSDEMRAEEGVPERYDKASTLTQRFTEKFVSEHKNEMQEILELANEYASSDEEVSLKDYMNLQRNYRSTLRKLGGVEHPSIKSFTENMTELMEQIKTGVKRPQDPPYCPEPQDPGRPDEPPYCPEPQDPGRPDEPPYCPPPGGVDEPPVCPEEPQDPGITTRALGEEDDGGVGTGVTTRALGEEDDGGVGSNPSTRPFGGVDGSRGHHRARPKPRYKPFGAS